jgi:2-phospho-L-lactate/phosphoenolpyruvate guanylyltransferase
VTDWHAIVPLNLGRDCKTRLAGQLSRDKRDRLVEAMARHVVAQVGAVIGISEVILLSPEDPQFSSVQWVRDEGRGLNAELAAVLGTGPVFVIHADLPTLETADVEALLETAQQSGAAIAPDRLGTGTNALALTYPSGIVPAFGEGSFLRHRTMFPDAAIVERAGLALDVDTHEDLDLARHRLPDMTG